MTLTELLLELGRAGVQLAPHPGQPDLLRHRPAKLPANLAKGVREHKASILSLLNGGHTPATFGAAPGTPAWCIATSDAMSIRKGQSLDAPIVEAEPCFGLPSDEASHVFHERLGVAEDLGLDTSVGSRAWTTAEREARRVAAGLPADEGTELVDDVLAAFADLGGMTLAAVEDDPGIQPQSQGNGLDPCREMRVPQASVVTDRNAGGQ